MVERRELHPVGTSRLAAGVGIICCTAVAGQVDRVAQLLAVDGEAVVLGPVRRTVGRRNIDAKLVASGLRQPVQAFVAEPVGPDGVRSVAEAGLEVIPWLVESVGGSVVALDENWETF